MKKQSKVTIKPPRVEGSHLSGITTGTYFRFVEASPKSRNGRLNSWTPEEAYQYLGPNGHTKYARVLRVDTGCVLTSVPRVSQVHRLRLVSIELEPDIEETTSWEDQ